MLIERKRRMAVLAVVTVAVFAVAAFLATRTPVSGLFRNVVWSAGTASIQRPVGAGLPARLAGLAEPTSADFYAAGKGTFAEPRVAVAAPEPTSADFYAAGKGEW